ncbi:PD-(D/E)XK nuclease family protein [Rossellomorea sp. NPDC077527]|uniref:PD-(D/E)XK nuclease family protein n=1 Tax=Rossellomorea sp. NPDC077527 TaxID=3364510 RepID=UPI0037CA4881
MEGYSAYVCRDKCGYVKRVDDFPRVIAQQGDDRLLLLYPNDQARIFDVRDAILWPQMHVEAILGRGYWEDYTGNQDIEMLLQDARVSEAYSIELPNLFQFATSELSQDAFLCWLMTWSKHDYRLVDEPLHEAALHFVAEIFKVHHQSLPEIKSIEITRQFKSLDILAIINDTYAILIEDKTYTKNHSNQLTRYREVVGIEYPKYVQLPIYFKIADQSHYRSIEKAGYKPFKRRMMLEVLKNGKDNGVKNAIFLDYYHHLQKIQDRIEAFWTVPVNDWNAFAWQGFYQELQKGLKGDWGYVSNPRGGFWGFWWESSGNHNQYIQLEEDRLCVKISADGEYGEEFVLNRLKDVLSESERKNLLLKKPARLRKGKTMTIAERKHYIQTNPDGTIDMGATIFELRKF